MGHGHWGGRTASPRSPHALHHRVVCGAFQNTKRVVVTQPRYGAEGVNSKSSYRAHPVPHALRPLQQHQQTVELTTIEATGEGGFKGHGGMVVRP